MTSQMITPQFTGAPPIAFVTYTRALRMPSLRQGLAANGLTVMDRPADHSTLDLIRRVAPRLVVLALRPGRDQDLMLLRRVEAVTDAPILVLLPGPGAHGVASALAAGADVCLRETDSPQIVLAQVAALARRTGAVPGGTPTAGEAGDGDGAGVLAAQDLRLDTNRFEARRGEELIPLTPTEFRILAVLVQNAGRVVSPAQILREIRGGGFTEVEAQSLVKVYVQRIRKKLGDSSARPRYVVNVRGFGYMVERRDPAAVARAAA